MLKPTSPFQGTFASVVPGLCSGHTLEMAAIQQKEMLAAQRMDPALRRSLRRACALPNRRGQRQSLQQATSIGYGGLSLKYNGNEALKSYAYPHVPAPLQL